jgi:hypothetical protein
MTAADYAPPLEGAYDGPGSPHVAVRVFYPKEYQAAARLALDTTIDSMKWFSETLGPYPYKTSTCVVPPYNAREAGGMEYQTFFTTESAANVDPETLGAGEVDFVTIHEFGHGYFYGILASNEFEEPMLDEGLNDFWDYRMMRARGREFHVTLPFLKRLGLDPVMSGFVQARAVAGLDPPRPADPIGQNAWDRLSTTSYGQVYSRTATVLHDLEERLGPEATQRAFAAYYAKWRFRHPSIADLREALAEASGNRAAVETVFRQNVFDAEPVDDRVESLSSIEELPGPGTTYEDGKWVERTREAVARKIEQARADFKKAHLDAKDGEGPFPYRTTVTVRRYGAPVPQLLRVQFEGGNTETAQWDDDRRWRRFVFVTPTRATAAELDPERRFYLDKSKLDDGRTLEPNRAASRRWAGDLSAIVQLLFSLVANL